VIVSKVDYSGIFHCGEGRDVEKVARTSIKTLCLRLAISVDLSNSTLYYSFIIIFVYLLLLQDYLF